MVVKLTDGSKQVAMASEQISTSNQDFAQGALEQASSLEETLSTMEEISTASAEPSDGVGSTNSSMQQMDAITQQNAATAEETALASEELSVQSQTLLELVGTLAMQVLDPQKGGNGDTTGYAEVKQVGEKKNYVSYQDNDKNGNKDVSLAIDEERLIPMGENRIKEHSEHFNDF